MQYWNSVLNDVLQKNEKIALGREMETLISEELPIGIKKSRDLRSYYLGDNYPDIYLTKREAECMFWVVQDYTIAATAAKMGLSARTVEFYVKNLKLKLSCASKKELIDVILQTTLLQQLEQDGLRMVRH